MSNAHEANVECEILTILDQEKLIFIKFETDPCKKWCRDCIQSNETRQICVCIDFWPDQYWYLDDSKFPN